MSDGIAPPLKAGRYLGAIALLRRLINREPSLRGRIVRSVDAARADRQARNRPPPTRRGSSPGLTRRLLRLCVPRRLAARTTLSRARGGRSTDVASYGSNASTIRLIAFPSGAPDASRSPPLLVASKTLRPRSPRTISYAVDHPHPVSSVSTGTVHPPRCRPTREFLPNSELISGWIRTPSACPPSLGTDAPHRCEMLCTVLGATGYPPSRSGPAAYDQGRRDRHALV